MNNNKAGSNPTDEEKDILEEEFLKLTEDDIPTPIEEIAVYEPEVQEVMKSGCNRQIAEYAILKYKKIEDNDKNSEKLYKLREEYNKLKNPIITNTVNSIEKLVNMDNPDKKNINYDIQLNEYEDEIEEIIKNEKIQKMIENNIFTLEIAQKFAKYYLKANINEEKDQKQFLEKRKAFYDKREAVIEAALRKVKKIVNDKEAYKIFYKEYFGKVLDEEEDN